MKHKLHCGQGTTCMCGHGHTIGHCYHTKVWMVHSSLASASQPASAHSELVPPPSCRCLRARKFSFLFYLLFFANNLPVPMPPVLLAVLMSPLLATSMPPCHANTPACHVNACPSPCQCLPPCHVNAPTACYLEAPPAHCINAPPTCCVDVAPCSLLCHVLLLAVSTSSCSLHRCPLDPVHCVDAPGPCVPRQCPQPLCLCKFRVFFTYFFC